MENCTRPDISYAVSYDARFSSDPTMKHWNYVKHILKYAKSTLETGIIYKKCKSLTIETFSDSDFASDTEQCKSTTRNITLINGSPISWNSNKQSTIALFSAESTRCVQISEIYKRHRLFNISHINFYFIASHVYKLFNYNDE